MRKAIHINYLSGIGKDIHWCRRATPGKKCVLCNTYAIFDKWSSEWYWYYIIDWTYPDYGRFRQYSHLKWKHRHYDNTANYRLLAYLPTTAESPVSDKIKRLLVPSPNAYILERTLRHKCKPNRKCRCVVFTQKAAWFCPDCNIKLIKVSDYNGNQIIYNTLVDKEDLKQDILMLMLAGI